MTKKPFKTRTANSKDDWITPPYFYHLLNNEFHFTLDPCAGHEILMGMVFNRGFNAKCAKFFTEIEDGLAQSWENETVFVNYPFNAKPKWIHKCAMEGQKRNTCVVMLTPATPDIELWHDPIMKTAHEIRFCQGRVNFVDPTYAQRNGSTFPLAVIIWHKTDHHLVTGHEFFPVFRSFDHKTFKKEYEGKNL